MIFLFYIFVLSLRQKVLGQDVENHPISSANFHSNILIQSLNTEVSCPPSEKTKQKYTIKGSCSSIVCQGVCAEKLQVS